MTSGRVLVIDDDRAFRFALGKALRRQGYETLEASSGEEALEVLKADPAPDAALLDLRMKGIDGLEVLRRRGGVRTQVIVLTGHGTVQAAVEAMRLGAFSFLEKPVDADELRPLLHQAVIDSRRRQTRASGKPDRSLAPPLVGVSAAMDQVRAFVRTVGPTAETVMILGDTGTGKEVVARHLHMASPRAGGPFVAMNAACVPRALFESELFGHRRGAFTGATADRLGLFREADRGTLFIDEVGELPLDSQAKILRAIEARAVRPVGGSTEQPVDVRIVVATNRDLWSEVNAGRFREDLYFRLQVFPLHLPPLRSRPEDIGPLAEHLLGRLRDEPLELQPEARAALADYDWPGNVRELLNVLRRASLFAERRQIDGDLVRRMLASSVFGQARAGVGAGAHPPAGERPPQLAPAGGDAPASLAEFERAHIERVLAQLDGNVTQAAIALGIDRRTLQRKLRQYGLSK
ncbi:MAG: sigma-54-dependent Fis family transcriptional regulator [Myxococcales bacterium]|nr:sigma-54-dependent Fis family transcriptional regulator [Myxococcales bacterium]